MKLDPDIHIVMHSVMSLESDSNTTMMRACVMWGFVFLVGIALIEWGSCAGYSYCSHESTLEFVPDVVRLVQDELATHVHTAYH